MFIANEAPQAASEVMAAGEPRTIDRHSFRLGAFYGFAVGFLLAAVWLAFAIPAEAWAIAWRFTPG